MHGPDMKEGTNLDKLAGNKAKPRQIDAGEITKDHYMESG